MGKFYGRIGYAETVEEPEGSGIWVPRITERFYYGEIGRSSRRLQSTGQVNDDIVIANEISIIADKFAYENFYAMKYVEYSGAKWKITNVEVQHPRLILTTGGIYNG